MKKVPDATKAKRVRELFLRAYVTFESFEEPADLGVTLFYLAGAIIKDNVVELIDGADGADYELLRWFRECWTDNKSKWIWRYLKVEKA